MRYVALLRGVNVGGKAPLKMADLSLALEADGFKSVKTYINSGNVIFSSHKTDTIALAVSIENAIKTHFSMQVPTVVVSQTQLSQLISGAPKKWGEDADWKYNILFLLPPYDMAQVVASIGTLKPDIETLVPGEGYLYQSMSIKLFGRTTTGKLASLPIYKQITVRNWNTTRKILDIMKTIDE